MRGVRLGVKKGKKRRNSWLMIVDGLTSRFFCMGWEKDKEICNIGPYSMAFVAF